jgi:transcriptional regulator with XRE-family HTH domain
MKQDKNGGPNFLQAWRERAKLSQEVLAEKIGTSPSVISYLEQGERGLSAKWLRRLAPVLGITPGLLLDHHPDDLSNDMIDMWVGADKKQRQQLTEIARTIIKDGTLG